jgi:uncharacterized protein YdbL (DUF1318 family)
MKQFKVTIQLGNDAMLDAEDISGALKEVAETITGYAINVSEKASVRGFIRDVNGNRVGWWEAK